MAASEIDPPPAGHWLPNVSAVTLALRGLLESQQHLMGVQARRLGMNTNDMQALRLLDVHGPLGPAELGRRLNLRSASVTVLLDRLETDGLVQRRRDPNDRRRIAVHVSPHAADRLFEVWAPLVRAIDDVSRALDPHTAHAVCDYFDRIAAIADTVASTPIHER